MQRPIEVIKEYEFRRRSHIVIIIGVGNYDGYTKSPVVLPYNGKVYNLQGWDSEVGHLFYSTNKVVKNA